MWVVLCSEMGFNDLGSLMSCLFDLSLSLFASCKLFSVFYFILRYIRLCPI